MTSASTDVPELVAHVTLAIYDKARIPGPRAERFAQALAMATETLRKQGHLGPNTDRLTLTASGQLLERKHKTDAGHRAKRLRFDTFYSALLGETKP